MQIIRAADCRRMPWKNGGGETTEIAIHPVGASLDTFVWRLSTARVAQDGPFSQFPGVDRSLAVIDGGPLRLTDPVASFDLDTGSDPHCFAADQAVEGSLPSGALTDLNVMTRRGRADHSMRRIAVAGTAEIALRGRPSLVFCAAGRIRVGDEHDLTSGDCVLGQNARLRIDGEGIVILVDILPPKAV